MWRTKGLTQPLTVKDLDEVEEWAGRLGIGNYHDRAKQLLSTENQKDRIRELLELSTIYGLRLFERTGLDNEGVGGEQQRVEMYEHVIRGVEGMRVLGHVQSFDYKYFNKAVSESKLHRNPPIRSCLLRAGMRRLGGSTASSATTRATLPRSDTRYSQSTRRSLTSAANWHSSLLIETARVSELMRSTERDTVTFNISSRMDSRASSGSASSMSTTFQDTSLPTRAEQPSGTS